MFYSPIAPKYFKANNNLKIKELMWENFLLRMLRGNKTKSLHKILISNHLSQRGIILTYSIFPTKCILIENENDNDNELSLLALSRL